nr:MAG: ORF1 [Torque teno midi virus]
MPYWWQRRKRWYAGRRRYTRNYRRKFKPRRSRKVLYRRRHRRPIKRRRRRRRTKVRRKLPFLRLLQWQPASIRKCKIKGFQTLVLGANGKQFRNSLTAEREWTPPKVPGGGGFAVSTYSLGFLYEQYKFRNNIWTASNQGKDLVRYTGGKITFYRHDYIDFIVYYSREYPMTINQFTYSQTHPHSLLLKKHKIIIPSKITNPNGKRKITKTFKPPRQMVNKWFFADTFESTPLLLLQACACDLTFVHLGRQGENQLMNLFYLNEKFYLDGSWGKNRQSDQPYTPVSTWKGTLTGTDYQNKAVNFVMPTKYTESINYTTGWFSTQILQLKTVSTPTTEVPVGIARYNPTIDDGKNNSIWLSSTLTYNHNKPQDRVLFFDNLPLWLLLFGWTDYVLKIKGDPAFLDSYILVIQSNYIRSAKTHGTSNIYIPLDESYIKGNAEYNTTPFPQQQEKWFPTLRHQLETINNIVKCGPNIARPEGKISNWELHCHYSFFFKWGGDDNLPTEVQDPGTLPTYPVPDKFSQTIQIYDPKTQTPQSIFHTWDYRRGQLTATAIKRMQENLPDESISSTDSDFHSPPKKIKLSRNDPPCEEKETEIQTCLQKLFEEPTCPEQATQENILQLIQQQQQQQHSIKQQFFKLLTHLKRTQRQMQLQAGILE